MMCDAAGGRVAQAGALMWRSCQHCLNVNLGRVCGCVYFCVWVCWRECECEKELECVCVCVIRLEKDMEMKNPGMCKNTVSLWIKNGREIEMIYKKEDLST